MTEWAGKSAVITGGGSGIGEALARRFAVAGMRVLVADIDHASAERVAHGIRANGGVAEAFEVDVADAGSVDAMAERSWSLFGSVDVLCNNAGVVPGGRHRAVWEYPTEDWIWSFNVNLMGVVHGFNAFVPRMIAQGTPGWIVTTASVAGLVSGSGSPVYGAAKHAAVRVTEALYASLKEIDSPIRVVLLCPGLVSTRIFESERNRPPSLKPSQPVNEPPEMRRISEHLASTGETPATIAAQVIAAMAEGRFYVLPTDRFDDVISARMEAILTRRNPQFESIVNLSNRPERPK